MFGVLAISLFFVGKEVVQIHDFPRNGFFAILKEVVAAFRFFFAGEVEAVKVVVFAVKGVEDEFVQVGEGGVAADFDDAVQFAHRLGARADEPDFQAVEVEGRHGSSGVGERGLWMWAVIVPSKADYFARGWKCTLLWGGGQWL